MTTLETLPESGVRHRHPSLAWRGTRTPTELLELARDYGADPDRVVLPPPGTGLDQRDYQLLELTDDVEIWLIHWPAGGRLDLHDHGGSAGALWVVAGRLGEQSVEGGRLADRELQAGTGAAFGPRYVHDVVNAGPAVATSVHAYSPPLPAMTFYRHGPEGLRADRTEYRADPGLGTVSVVNTDGDRPAVDRRLELARSGLNRVGPEAAYRLQQLGALLVDIRPVAQRQTFGEIPGAVIIERNVLEWRLDPGGPDRIGEADDPDRVVVVVCQEGYASSLAARSLVELGRPGATDLDGGFAAWAGAGLPVTGG